MKTENKETAASVSSEKEVYEPDDINVYKPDVKDWYIPNHLQIETVTNLCNARCIMCPIDDWKRTPNIMDNEIYTEVLKKFLPYRDQLKFLSLFCCGESLLDKNFPDKVRIASEMEFNSIGIASNCDLLDDHTAQALIENGLDTVICGIDGITKETHETIRTRTNYDNIHANVLNFIKRRNESDKKTKVLIRFIRQQENKHEWEEYYDYWISRIDPEYGDDVVKFDVHNVGGELKDYESRDIIKFEAASDIICQDVFEKFLVYSDGAVALCNGDDNGFFEIGNVLETEPMEIYNGEVFNRYRQQMLEGNINNLEHCDTCTIPRSRMYKTPID